MSLRNKHVATRISLVSGTKAQFIKMMPVAWELEKRGIPYRLVNTGQHESKSADLRREYDVRPPDHSLSGRSGNISTIGQGVAWLGANLCKYAIRGRATRRTLFDGECGIALVHGDTASTVLATVIAKRARQKVMHIEAGLRSWNRLSPFPEELIRILVMRMADYLVAPSKQAYSNLLAMNLRGRSWQVGGNTLIDVIASDLSHPPIDEGESVRQPYVLVTVHRMETLYNRRRLEMVVNNVLRVAEETRVIFVQHAPTARRLAAYGMLELLEHANVKTIDLMDHRRFVHLIKNANFVMTDGGSIQEEASYLGVPCLLLRTATERFDGLEGNVVLSKMDPEKIQSFVDTYGRYRRPMLDFDQVRPSSQIVDILESLIDAFE